MKNNKIGLSIFLIILSIFYYEGRRKIPEFKKNIIIDFKDVHKIPSNKKLKYTYKLFEESSIKKIKLKAYCGKISIKTNHDIDKIKIKAIIGYSGEKAYINKSMENGELYLKGSIPENFNGEIGYEIETPEKIDYELINRNGIIEIDGASNIKIDDKYSDMNIKDIKSISIQSGYGDIYIDRVKENVNISTKYSKMRFSNIKGSLSIKTKYGKSIEINNLNGDLEIDTKFTPVIIDNASGKLKIKHRYCENLEINNSGDIQLETSYSKISVNNSNSLSLIGKENRIFGKVIKLNIKGKGNKIEGGSDEISLEGKYDNINMTIKKRGKIIEEQGHIKLEIDKISQKFSFNLISTSSYIKIKDTNNTLFDVRLNWGVLNSDFLHISTNKNIIKGVYGDISEKNIFLLNSKYSTITIIR
jgi:hypothetical protein